MKPGKWWTMMVVMRGDMMRKWHRKLDGNLIKMKESRTLGNTLSKCERIGAIYTTVRARPTLCMACAGCGLLHLYLLPGPDCNQTFHILITASASSVCHTSRLKLIQTRFSCVDYTRVRTTSMSILTRVRTTSMSILKWEEPQACLYSSWNHKYIKIVNNKKYTNTHVSFSYICSKIFEASSSWHVRECLCSNLNVDKI